MCNSIAAFQTDSLQNTNTQIKLGDHSHVLVSQEGTVIVENMKLKALFVPCFRISLLSVPQLDKDGWLTTFRNGVCTIQNSSHNSRLTASLINNLYRLEIVDSRALITTRSMAKTKNHPPDILAIVPPEMQISANSKETPTRFKHITQPVPNLESVGINIWHRRLGHLHSGGLKILGVPPSSNSDLHQPICDICIRAKHRQHFQRIKVPRSTVPFELVHSDLSGPFKPSVGGATYYILYIDDCTRYTEVYLLQTKSSAEIIPKFEHYKAWVQNQGFSIKRFRCDNGKGEFNNADFHQVLGKAGIEYQPAPPYTQHKNGIAERMIQTLNMRARCMLLDSGLPIRFWAEAIKTACYLHRRTPSSSLPGNLTPYETLYGSPPKIHHLRRFGCAVYKHIPKELRDSKFGNRSKPCMMLGYVHRTTKIWRLWDFSGRGRAIESSNAIFKEEENAYDKANDAKSSDEH